MTNTATHRSTIVKNIRVHFSSLTDHWSTPKSVYDALDKEFKFDDDPCPLHSTDDGLHRPWGKRVFVNPPYSKIKEWVANAYAEHLINDSLIVMLIPSRTDTRWWHEYVMKAHEIRFIKGRLKFGNSKNSAPFPSCVVVFKGDNR